MLKILDKTLHVLIVFISVCGVCYVVFVIHEQPVDKFAGHNVKLSYHILSDYTKLTQVMSPNKVFFIPQHLCVFSLFLGKYLKSYNTLGNFLCDLYLYV